MWNGSRPGQLDAEHHHPGDPEEDDVVAGLHDRRRVVASRSRRVVVRPAEGRERPQPGAEPGVEDVRILLAARRPDGRTRAQASGPSISADTVTCPSGQYQAGIRWPHQSWRETFQSRMLVSQCSQVFSKRSGRIRVRPDRVASSARAASGPVRMNHWVLSRGSMTSLLRWQRPMTISCGRWPARSPRASRSATIAVARREPVQPVVARAGAGDAAVVGQDGRRRRDRDAGRWRGRRDRAPA